MYLSTHFEDDIENDLHRVLCYYFDLSIKGFYRYALGKLKKLRDDYSTIYTTAIEFCQYSMYLFSISAKNLDIETCKNIYEATKKISVESAKNINNFWILIFCSNYSGLFCKDETKLFDDRIYEICSTSGKIAMEVLGGSYIDDKHFLDILNSNAKRFSFVYSVFLKTTGQKKRSALFILIKHHLFCPRYITLIANFLVLQKIILPIWYALSMMPFVHDGFLWALLGIIWLFSLYEGLNDPKFGFKRFMYLVSASFIMFVSRFLITNILVNIWNAIF